MLYAGASEKLQQQLSLKMVNIAAVKDNSAVSE
jgi:hypothetical protein